MKNPGRLAAAMVCVLIAAGCKGKERGHAAEDSTASSSDSAPAPAALPHPVEQAEALAEDIQADIDQGAWPAATSKLDSLRTLADRLAAAGVSGTQRSAYGSALDTLNAVVVVKSKDYALVAANRVSRIVTTMMADYASRVPVAVAYMDVAGRDALYGARLDRWSDVSDAALEVGRNYASVEAHVQARDSVLGRRVASEIKQLQDAVSAKSKTGAAGSAEAILNDVDRIEQTY